MPTRGLWWEGAGTSCRLPKPAFNVPYVPPFNSAVFHASANLEGLGRGRAGLHTKAGYTALHAPPPGLVWRLSRSKACAALLCAGGGNDLADAWREGFDPGVAAAALYCTFGEAVLPYLPGTPLPCVTL